MVETGKFEGWAYKYLLFNPSLKNMDMFLRRLNKCGHDGWEVFFVEKTTTTFNTRFWMKMRVVGIRRIEE